MADAAAMPANEIEAKCKRLGQFPSGRLMVEEETALIVAALRAAAWIPVSERLPDDEITVMLALNAGDEPVWIGFHDADGWHSADAVPLGKMVTHWKPMPEGPNG